MKLGVVMDPIAGINIKKDSTFAMLLAAQRRGWSVHYMEARDLYIEGAEPMARMRSLSVKDDKKNWFSFESDSAGPLSGLDVILMRKDPPVNMEYMNLTHLLELAARKGVKVVNNPASLRDANEKLFICHFPQCIPPTLVARDAALINEFIARHGEAVLKPLDYMGGVSVFRVRDGDANQNVIIESITGRGSTFIMAQKFLPEIFKGDKRILLINGEPIPHALARIPREGDFRGNLAAGGRGEGMDISERDRWICAQVAPVLKAKGLVFVGLDVIGDYLTEINVTSPTCIRELDAIYGLDIAGRLLDSIAS